MFISQLSASFRTLLGALCVIVAASGLGSCASTSTIPFNGENLDGWHTDIPDADGGAEVAASFGVEDGMLKSYGTPEGHLITDGIYRDYRLTVEYRFPGEPGNCGILVHCSTPRRLYGMFPASIECQLNSGHAGDFWCIGETISTPDMEKRRNPDPSTWGGEKGQSRRILNLTDDSENPVGEWNTMVIECRGDTIDIWVNGDHVNSGYDCTASEGQIAVQAEGVPCDFRKIELEPL
ncbi:hypothetical protein Poly30_54140 [Planctomycetes bacterium Poly30]|uniref:3-keto-alpha-glucoside-1,2-lyase/3-keto-2-hydroxy-glucal hydratase domain-containing protein n=1 Tax=Saltatorellus ferox TaxID=2528018 RepID=A0A518F0J1_9BACT|nr:hypothetical protein Poly30_54140 [Planctomycetes bacterium Poly30]